VSRARERSLLRADLCIWRTRSRVTPIPAPISERGTPAAVETVAAFDDVALALGEGFEKVVYVSLEGVLHKQVLRFRG
jgi:hypothetical protein